jgi:NADPH-dependent glutamate synthase beta subunit-like oxidoreductase
VTPTKILTTSGLFSGLEYVGNELGEPDSSGRRRPVPIEGTEQIIELDTLIVAISEDSGIDSIGPARSSGIETTEYNTVRIDKNTLLTSRPGVFGAGDVVTGPNTVIEAIAAGKKVASMIYRYLRNEELVQTAELNLPTVYLEPLEIETDKEQVTERVETPRASVEWRKRNFAEVEVSLSIPEATREACRCLRCDLEFTKPEEKAEKLVVTEAGGA